MTDTPSPSPRSPRIFIVGGLALAAALGGLAVLRAPPGSVTTDNAYLKSDRTVVATRVRGQVAQVLVADNQTVAAGQVLVRLDSAEFQSRLASAQGDLAIAEAQVETARGALERWNAEKGLAGATVRQAQTDIQASDAQAARAQADWKRYESLVADGAVSRRDAERVRADAASAQANAERSHAALAVSQNQAAVTDHRQSELTAALMAAQAQRAKAAANLDLARQDADHTEIHAPVAGVVGDRQANPGDFVQPGVRLLTLVPVADLHVVANFKETQTSRMLVGQAATIRVDALEGVKLKAHVQSFAPGSGSEFALLPFEPGSGNFTKIVQRVPVRLTFDPGQPELARLRPGLSAKVTVKLR